MKLRFPLQIITNSWLVAQLSGLKFGSEQLQSTVYNVRFDFNMFARVSILIFVLPIEWNNRDLRTLCAVHCSLYSIRCKCLHWTYEQIKYVWLVCAIPIANSRSYLCLASVIRNRKQWLWFKALVLHSAAFGSWKRSLLYWWWWRCSSRSSNSSKNHNNNNEEIKHQSSNCPWTKNTYIRCSSFIFLSKCQQFIVKHFESVAKLKIKSQYFCLLSHSFSIRHQCFSFARPTIPYLWAWIYCTI